MRRRRPFHRFSPNVERLESRDMLSGVPFAPQLPPAALNSGSAGPVNAAVESAVGDVTSVVRKKPGRTTYAEVASAVGEVEGQVEVLGVVSQGGSNGKPAGDGHALNLAIYNYTQPTAASNGGFGGAQILSLDDLVNGTHPTGALIGTVQIAFGNLNNAGIPDLAVAISEGHGSVAVELFTSVQEANGNWQFTPFTSPAGSGTGAAPSDIFHQSFGPVQAGRQLVGLSLSDVNGDGIPDVVLATQTQVGVLLAKSVQNNGQVGYDYQSLPAVASPFSSLDLAAGQTGPGQGGAATGAQEKGDDGYYRVKVQFHWDRSTDAVADVDGNGQPDLVTLAGNQVLYSQLNVSNATSGAAGASITFGSVESIAVLPSGSSSPTPLSVLPGAAPGLDGGLSRGIFVVPNANADGSSDLVVVIGDQVYVGTGSVTKSTTSSTVSFTWHVDTISPQPAHQPLFLGDVSGDGQLDLFTLDGKGNDVNVEEIELAVEKVEKG